MGCTTYTFLLNNLIYYYYLLFYLFLVVLPFNIGFLNYFHLLTYLLSLYYNQPVSINVIYLLINVIDSFQSIIHLRFMVNLSCTLSNNDMSAKEKSASVCDINHSLFSWACIVLSDSVHPWLIVCDKLNRSPNFVSATVFESTFELPKFQTFKYSHWCVIISDPVMLRDEMKRCDKLGCVFRSIVDI